MNSKPSLETRVTKSEVWAGGMVEALMCVFVCGWVGLVDEYGVLACKDFVCFFEFGELSWGVKNILY